MTVSVNGEMRDVGDGTTLAALLGELRVRSDGSAVALNDEVVPHGRYGETVLRDGDRLEIIVAVAGG